MYVMRCISMVFSFFKRRSTSSEEEFASLIQENLPGLYRVALRYTRQTSLAEDLVQDTVMRALRFRHRFEPGSHFRAWIFTILTNTFLQKYRRSKRERDILEGVSQHDVQQQLVSDTTAFEAEEPETAYLHHVLSDDVQKALDDLPEEYSVVVTLCDMEGLSYKEISEVLDCPIGTVMSRLFRGRKMLAKKLKHLAVERGYRTQSIPHVAQEQQPVLDLSQYRKKRAG